MWQEVIWWGSIAVLWFCIGVNVWSMVFYHRARRRLRENCEVCGKLWRELVGDMTADLTSDDK